ncbi:hypothetical protein M3Y97_01044300 [Aphelenchoides bicaudatus]|nr:hypothetical protein M3Y97_01044300 [Aphelenchoides bicaudatus]
MKSNQKGLDIFEMSASARDKEIAQLKQKINEVNTSLSQPGAFDFKYDDEILRACSNLDITQKLEKLDDSLSTIVDKLNLASQEIDKKSVRPQVEVIDKLKKRLSNFVELRDGMRYLNIDYSKLRIPYKVHAERLLKLRNLKESALKSNDYDAEVPEPKILQGYSDEVEMEVERFVRFLYALFDSFAYVVKDDDGYTKLSINSDDSDLMTDVCRALQLLDSFDEKFLSLIDVIWSEFCETFLSAAEPEEQFMLEKELPSTMHFTVNTQFTASEKQNPSKLLHCLNMFFSSLKNALEKVKFDGRPICEMIGANLGGRLVEKFVLRLCAAAANSKVLDEKMSRKYQKLVEDFDKSMKSLGFFVDNSFSASEVFSRSSRLIVNQRCRVFLASARAQVFKPSIDLIRVKGVDFDWSKDEAEIDRQLAELSISRDELIKGPEEDKFFAFKECSISASTQKIVSIFGELLKLSNDSTNEMEALNYFQAALVIIDTFLVSTPRLHQQTLLTIPQSGAVFYNDCHYIFHALMCYKMNMKLKTTDMQYYDFGNTFKSLRQSAVKILDHHINAAKRQLSTTLSEPDLFTNINAKRAACDRILNACTMQIEQLAKVWREVMSGVVYELSIGSLVAHLLHLLSNTVLQKEDITANDAEVLGQMLPSVLNKMRTLMKIDDEEGIYVVCRTQYFRINEIVFCLNSNLLEISDRWCEGIGPMAVWMKPSEVKGLICALFQNTERRADVLKKIKTRN